MAVPVTIVDKNGAPVTVINVDGQPINFGDYVEKSSIDQPNGVAGLDASGKIEASAMPVGDVTYQGNWNAATNTPTLANGVGAAGDLHICDAAGTQNLGGGSVAYGVGDWLIYDGAAWDRVPGAGAAPANPTALVGTAAINGAALTFMRSDAAPAINQAIVPTWTGAHSIITGTDGRKLWLGKYDSGSGHNNAAAAIGAAATYMYVGGREYGNNGYGGIGFSYVADTTNNPAVWIGWQETNTAGNTMGDFIVATRPVTTNTAPIERLRVPAAGNVQVAGSVSAAVTTAVASPTNSGVVISSAPNNADVVLYDSTQTANNRTAEWINFQGKLQARFKNDAGSAANVPLAFVGGQATGITGIESNSGSGAWIHTGSFALGGVNATLMVGGSAGTPGQVLTSTGNATTPSWSDAPLPKVVGGASATAQSANVNTPNFYAVAIGGMYRVSTFIVITRAATTSATMPSVSVGYTEAASGANVQDIVSLSSVANTVGSHSGGTAVIQCQQGSNISYLTSNYASSGATSMQYRVDVIVERIS